MAAPKPASTPPGAPPRPSPEENVVVAIIGPIRRADIDALCARVRRIAEASEVTVVICDVRDLGSPDGEALDALARLQLMARRIGREMRLRNASPELRELLALAGLADILR